MKISTKLIGISCCSAVIVTAIAATLFFQLRAESNGYDDLLQGPVKAADAARQTEVDFKKQIQEWKDILLRGQSPDDLAHYTRAFHEQESRVKAETRALAYSVDDPASKQVLDEFLKKDDDLSVRYQTAYDAYLKGHYDFKAADQLVRGQDRPVTDLLDQVVVSLNSQVASVTDAQHARTAHNLQILTIVAAIVLLVDSYFYCSVLFGVFRRLARLKVVSDHLAKADINGLSIDISGKDEIGEIGESMKGVKAAIEELLAVHAH
jgi:methyl-accepting chemotaxis protein